MDIKLNITEIFPRSTISKEDQIDMQFQINPKESERPNSRLIIQEKTKELRCSFEAKTSWDTMDLKQNTCRACFSGWIWRVSFQKPPKKGPFLWRLQTAGSVTAGEIVHHGFQKPSGFPWFPRVGWMSYQISFLMAQVKAMALNISSRKIYRQKKNSTFLAVFLSIIQNTSTRRRTGSFVLKFSKFLKVNLKDILTPSKITLESMLGLLLRK